MSNTASNSTAKNLINSSALRVITLIIGIAVSFFMMPFIIRSLGSEAYGLWSVIASIFGLYNLLDMGISNATQRFIALVLPKRDRDEINSIINTSIVIFIVIGFIAFLLTLLVTFLAPVFTETAEHIRTFRVVTLIMGSGLAIGFPFIALNGVLSANLRYDLGCYTQLTKIAIRTPLIIYLLSTGHSLIAMAIATVAIDFLGNLMTLVFAKKLFPDLAFAKKYFDRSRIKELADYAKYTFIAMIAEQIRLNTDNLIIGAHLTLSSVTIFQIAAQLVSYYSRLIGQATSVMLPVYTRYLATNDHVALKESFLLATRINVFFATLGAGGLIIFGQAFITLWLDDTYLEAYSILLILLVATMYEMMQTSSVNLIYALSKHKFYAYIVIAEAIINLVLSLLLVKKFGMLGVALGTAIPMLISKLFILPLYTCKCLQLPLKDYLKPVLQAHLAVIAVQVPVYFYITTLHFANLLHLFAVAAGLYLLLTVVVLNVFARTKEKQLLTQHARFFKKLIYIRRDSAQNK